MVDKGLKLFLLLSVVVVSVSFVSADFTDCWQYRGDNGGTNATCASAGCVWSTIATDPWCDDSVGCCNQNECWQHDQTNESYCENSAITGLNCTWDPYMTMWYPNGSQASQGGCMNDWAAGGMVWGGMDEGCWQYDGDKASCTTGNNAQKCQWKANSQNENNWCWIKTLSDAIDHNPSATSTDIGCCDMKGCWTYDNNQSLCDGTLSNETTTYGLCWYDTSGGWCGSKWCGDINNSADCSKMKKTLFMPCTWNTTDCVDEGGGGFFSYNDTDSCMMSGGWWNSSSDCVVPTGSIGGGGFMFGEDATCWFADNQQNICQNLTGCAYCVAGTGANGVSNTSSNNICSNKPVGFCEGHDKWSSQSYANANNTVGLSCADILIRGACSYGPLPNCVWQNSSAESGAFCAVGTASSKKIAPPVGFCEHPDAINNYTMCNDLATIYMMPCKWGNASSNKTLSDNCTFNSNAVFGKGDMEKEFEVITSEYSCLAAGGNWKKVYYLEDNALKQDSWCEKGALFDLNTGIAFGNKGNCDLDCWACEFQANGTAWPDTANASGACTGSALGYCRWTNDSAASNTFGWCDYPKEMSYGAGDCQASCKDCNLQQNAYSSCINSAASCKWVNNTASSFNDTKMDTGNCVGKGKKTCDDDCFSCYDFSSCNTSSVDCGWSNSICSPASFDGEICFDGADNDGDKMTDCAALIAVLIWLVVVLHLGIVGCTVIHLVMALLII